MEVVVDKDGREVFQYGQYGVDVVTPRQAECLDAACNATGFVDAASPRAASVGIAVVANQIEVVREIIALLPEFVQLHPQVKVLDAQQAGVVGVTANDLERFTPEHRRRVDIASAAYKVGRPRSVYARYLTPEDAVFVKPRHHAAHEVHIGMGIKIVHLDLESLGQRDVVAVHARYQFGLRQFETSVERLDEPHVALIGDDGEPSRIAPGIVLCQSESAVGRAVVAHYHVEVVIGLSHQRVERLGEGRLTVVYAHDN